MNPQTPTAIDAASDLTDLDWAMLNLPGVPASEAAALRRRERGGHVADLSRARFARRYYGQRWSRVERARQRYARRRQQAAAVEALAVLLMSDVRPRDLAEACAMVRRALAR